MNTRNKRSSAIQPMLPWRGYYPAPDGTVDQADRQHSAFMYAGILAEEAADGSTGEPAILCHPMTLNLSIVPMAALAIDPMRYVYVAARPYTVNLTIAPMATVEIRPMKVRCC